MLKMFQAERAAAGSAEFWEESWSDARLASVLDDPAVCENDPLFPLLRGTLVRDRLFLEGGCGQAQWVKYFADRGQRAVGIDFAERTIAAVRRHAPTLDVRIGNILDLPFGRGEVHTYYSGGVVEHFEDGPLPALVEARRVIADDGWLLCSVPDESPLRRRLYRSDEVTRPDLDPPLVVRRVEHTTRERPPAGHEFFQYCFAEQEFSSQLEAAGFRVERTFGCGMIWGLLEVPWLAALWRRATERRQKSAPARSAAASVAPSSAKTAGRAGRPGLAKRALVLEDPSLPLLGALRQRCSNMRMFVARPRI
jgi:SAM-dependent methyltransferase